MQLDKHLTGWQLYHMALEPDFEPILPLIVLHERAYPELVAWYEQYQSTGVFGEIPMPSEPEESGWFVRKGKLPSLQQVDAYVQEQQAMVLHHNIETDSGVVERHLDSAVDAPAPALLPNVESVSESFDDSVAFGFDWRIVKRAGAAIVVCAVLVGLGVGGMRWHEVAQQQRLVQAQSVCTVSVQQVQSHARDFNKLLKANQTSTVLSYQDQDVSDQQVLTTLHKAAKNPKASAWQCDGKSLSDVQHATEANTALADTLNKRTAALRKAVQAVRQSHRKQLAAERGELQVAMDGAQALLDSSSGKVADENTRNGLHQALDQARIVYEDEHVDDVSTYVNAGKALVDAQSAVQQSIDAKVQADEQAKQQAAHDAQSQPTGPSPNYVRVPQSRTPSTAPRQSTPQSQPTAPPSWSVPAPSSNPLPDNDGSL